MAGEVFVKSSTLKVTWQPDGAPSAIDVSGQLTDWEWSEESEESTFELIAGKQTIVDPADTKRSAKISGRDIAGNPRPDWESTTFAPGTKGTLVWMPEGDFSGKRKNTAVAYVKSRSGKTNPKTASWDIALTINGEIAFVSA